MPVWYATFKAFCEKITAPIGQPWWLVPAGVAFIIAVVL